MTSTASPPTVSWSAGAREWLLAFADDEHMVGARHTSWIGLGPFLEEDLAFCSIAQDELGHAIALYGLLLDDAGRSADQLDAFALMRPADEYRSSWLAEAECNDWNDALVRHWLYDTAEALRWEALVGSCDPRLVALAARAMREESFHLAHAEQLMSRIAPTDPGPILGALDRLLPLAIASWEPTVGEAEALADGIITASSADLAARWADIVRSDMARFGLDVAWPDDGALDDQQNRTVRSDAFEALQADLQKVVVLDPAAVW